MKSSAIDAALGVIAELPPTRPSIWFHGRVGGRPAEHDLILGPVVQIADEDDRSVGHPRSTTVGARSIGRAQSSGRLYS